MRRIPVCSTMAALAGFLLVTSSAKAQSPAPEVGAPPSSSATASFSGASSVRGRGSWSIAFQHRDSQFQRR